MFRHLTTSIAIAFGLAAAAFGGNGDAAPGQMDVRVPMRDGQSLAADVWLPATPGRHPTILIQTPYNRKLHRPALRLREGRGIFDREHYAFVIVDWRGFYESKGALVAGARPKRGRDGYDAVEWIAKQPWSDGKVGTWGPSALGKIQFMTAIEQPPHLVCCAPLVAANSYYYEDFYANGVRREAHLQDLERLGFGAFSDRPLMGDSARLFRLLSRLPDRIERINVPMFMITGWYDHGVPQELDTFRALKTRAGEATRANTNMLIGPWHHSAIGKAQQGALRYEDAEGESERAALLFFDYWLRDQKDNPWADAPLLRWRQMNEGEWLASQQLAGPQTQDSLFHLRGDGLISTQIPAPDEPSRSYTSDPEDPVPTIGGANLPLRHGQGKRALAGPYDQSKLEARDDVLVYTTEPAKAPLRIFGSVAVRLSFAVDQRDATFAVRLCEVYPDGRSMLICDSATRAKYRDGPERPLPVEPGATYAATATLPATAITIQPGHSLRVSICGSNYPRFQLNDGSGEDGYDPARAVPVKCTIFHDEAHPTTMTLPVLR